MTTHNMIAVIGALFVLIGMICLYLSGTTAFVFGVSFNVIGWCVILINYFLQPRKHRN